MKLCLIPLRRLYFTLKGRKADSMFAKPGGSQYGCGWIVTWGSRDGLWPDHSRACSNATIFEFYSSDNGETIEVLRPSDWYSLVEVMSNSLRCPGLYSPWNSPGQNTGVGSLSLLQGIFPTQGSNLGLPHWRQILYQLSHKGSWYGLDDCKKITLASEWKNLRRLRKYNKCVKELGWRNQESYEGVSKSLLRQ